jgi:hypothetical protein
MGILIIRPSRRWYHRQLASLAALAAAAVAAAWWADGRSGATVAAALGALGLIAAWSVQGHALQRGARALVADGEYLALLERSGRRHLPWAAVRAARHTTTSEGMRWTLATEAGELTVGDVGVPPERWGDLWQVIVREVAGRGGDVRVDPLSDALFGSDALRNRVDG